MARSLFEPAPEPFSSRFWRKMKHLNIGLQSAPAAMEKPAPLTDHDVARHADNLDARGRQLFLEDALASRPIRRR